MAYKSTNPYTGKVIATFETLTDNELEVKMQKAEKAFKTWSATSIKERAAIVRKAAHLVQERKEKLAALNTIETGKLFTIASWEMNMVSDIFEYYASHAEEFLRPEKVVSGDTMAGNAIGIYQPLGIIYEIEPWNVPYFQITRPLAAQLMAGNVVVLKHASNVPQCAASMEQLMLDAGLPEGVFQNLYVNYDQSDRIIADPRVCGITITGSTEGGRGVAANAGQNLKKIVLELGGSDAMIVLDDADLQTAVEGALLGRMTISGQVCAGDKRMFVHERLFDAFKQGVKEAAGKLIAGDPMDPATTLSPLCSAKAADKVQQQIALAVAHGAQAEEIGPRVPADCPTFVQPTILTHVTEDNPIFDEEIFGPVLQMYSFSDEDEAIRLANHSQFGLGGSVYSRDASHALRVATRIEAGAISINQPTMASPAIPFGGIKNSGYGREMGREGIVEFTNQKFINTAAFDLTQLDLSSL